MSELVRVTIKGLQLKAPGNGSQGISRAAMRRRAKRNKRHRTQARFFTGRALGALKLQPPIMVRLTRESPRELDSDNLAGAFKYIRDGVADAIGLASHDRDGPIAWDCVQRPGPTREPAVVIEIHYLERGTDAQD